MDLKLLSVRADAIPRSLLKAHQYRLLSEPSHAESICRDVLRADPGNQQALDILALSITDQFKGQHDLQERFDEALSVQARLTDPYRRAYLKGLILERQAMALFIHNGTSSGAVTYGGLLRAMEAYEQAMDLRPPDDDNAVLRWNTCVRMLRRYPELKNGKVCVTDK